MIYIIRGGGWSGRWMIFECKRWNIMFVLNWLIDPNLPKTSPNNSIFTKLLACAFPFLIVSWEYFPWSLRASGNCQQRSISRACAPTLIPNIIIYAVRLIEFVLIYSPSFEESEARLCCLSATYIHVDIPWWTSCDSLPYCY